MPDIRVDTQFSIFLINKPGVLSSVTTALSEAGINLFALSLVDSGEHGVLRVVGSDREGIRKALRTSHDRWTETDIIVVPLGNEPGSFATIANNLSDNGVDVTYSYCTASEEGGVTNAIFKCKNTEQALELLKR